LAFGLARNANMRKIDNKGLTPDVKVPRRKADWVSYASEYLSKNK
jgi:C-terminal processing protease CtpA/Prc